VKTQIDLEAGRKAEVPLDELLTNIVAEVKVSENKKRSQHAGKQVFHSAGFEKHGFRLATTSKGQEFINEMLQGAATLQAQLETAKILAAAEGTVPSIKPGSSWA
jgi:hypothetical protein